MTPRDSTLLLTCSLALVGVVSASAPLAASAQDVAPPAEQTPEATADDAEAVTTSPEVATTSAAPVDDSAQDPVPADEPSPVVSFLQQNVAIHGFGTWGMGVTFTPSGGDRGFNQYQFGRDRGDFSQTEFALREIVQATPEIRLAAGQSFRAAADGGVRLELDLANAEWTPTPAVSVRAGRVLTPMGFYTENYRVGTLRPFAVLPQSVYGPGGYFSQYYDGLGATFRARTDNDWQVRAEVFAGHMFVPVDPSIIVLINALLGVPYQASYYANTGSDLAFMGGTALWVQTPIEGLSFMGGAIAAPARMVGRDTDHTLSPWTWHLSTVAGVAYVTDRLEIRSEFAYRLSSYEKKLDPLGRGMGGYLEVGYRVIESLQLAVRGEINRGQIDTGFLPLGNWDTILDHNDLGVSVNYWWNRDLVTKLSYHYVYGNRFAHPSNQVMYDQIVAGAGDPNAGFQQATHYASLVTSFAF